jgi:hypothetical protein
MLFLKFNMNTLRSNLVSGFATGLFSIPEGMAYAKLAGVNPVYGLYSGMISTIVASLTTGSILMIGTLTSAIAGPNRQGKNRKINLTPAIIYGGRTRANDKREGWLTGATR